MCMYLIQKRNAVLQVIHTFLDLPVCPELFTDRGNRILLALREHIILDKLTRSVRHTKCNRTFLHRHQPSRINIAENRIVHGIQISFFGRIDAVHIHASPVILGLTSCIYEFFQLIHGIRCPFFCQIFILRHPPAVTEKTIFLQIQIIFPNFKCSADTSRHPASGIHNFQHDLGTEIHIFPIRCSILLCAP